MKRIYSILFALVALLCATTANAKITKWGGWFEAAYCEWDPIGGESGWNVYIKGGDYSDWTQIDAQLVRKYSGYYRADMVGLKPGTYQMQARPVYSGQESVLSYSYATTKDITVVASDRSGFAHYGRTTGIGAYNNDGTLKTDARIIYLTAANAKTVKCNVSDGSKDTEYTGIQAILSAYEKGKETRPLDIRIIGTVKKADLDACGSSAEGLQVKGKSGDTDMNITIEGIGNDATVHGFGFLVRSAGSVEFRNFAIMICMDDCLSLDTDNKHCWIHNMDFFYGGTGGDADQAKGDGTVDIKGKSSFITVSYNHFYDSGKCSLGGMKSETTDCWMTYHHNWFDHSDSRHPRIRTAFYHVYNNYFDGNAKYATGVTMGGSAFCESNYYRNTKYPFLSSKQGTDAQGDGTFSGENGGVIKAYNNKIINAKQVLYYDGSQTDGAWDAVKATSRDENVTATAFTGGTSYNNDATTEAIKAVPASAIDAPENVAAICRGEFTDRKGLGAGRLEGGDFKWTFQYTTQDTNYGVITELKSALVSYASTLVTYGDGTAAKNAGGTAVDGGDGKGVTQSYGDDTPKPEYGGGGDAPETDDMQAYLTSISSQTMTDGDFFWFNTDNDATTSTKVVGEGKVITLTNGESTSSYAATPDASDENKYGVCIGKTNGNAVFYCSTGIPYISAKCYRTGKLACTAYQSEDGQTWTKIADYSTTKSGTFTESFATTGTTTAEGESEVTTYPKYVKIENTATGGMYIQGIKIYTVKGGEAAIEPVTITDDNNANASLTLDATAITSQSYTKNIDYADETASYTVVVTPEVAAATVTATSAATPVEGQTNTWTIAAPEKSSQAKVNVKFTVTSKDGTNSKVYSVSILRGDAPAGATVYDFNAGIGSTDGTTGAPAAFTDKTSVKFGGNAQYIIITPATGESFKSGDKVEVTGSCGSDSKDMGVYLATAADGRTSGTAVYTAAATKNQSYTANGTLTLTADADKLYVFRYAGTATTITEIKISHSTEPAKPVINAADASILCKNDGVQVTKDVAISGANLTGTTLTATLSPAVDNLSVTLSNSTIENGAITTTATLKYSGTTTTKGTTTLTISDGTTTKDVTISYSCVALLEQTEVTGAATWDFSKLGATEVKLTESTSPAKSTDWVLLANFNAVKSSTLGEITPDASFDAQALMWQGEYIVRGGEYTQVDSIKLKTTQVGKFEVTYANTGNRADAAANYRFVKINDVVASKGSISTTMATVTLENVPAGEVVITGVTTDGTTYTHAMLRIAKIVFTPGATAITNVDADVNANQKSGKYLKNGKLVIVNDGKTYNAAGARVK